MKISFVLAFLFLSHYVAADSQQAIARYFAHIGRLLCADPPPGKNAASNELMQKIRNDKKLRNLAANLKKISENKKVSKQQRILCESLFEGFHQEFVSSFMRTGNIYANWQDKYLPISSSHKEAEHLALQMEFVMAPLISKQQRLQSYHQHAIATYQIVANRGIRNYGRYANGWVAHYVNNGTVKSLKIINAKLSELDSPLSKAVITTLLLIYRLESGVKGPFLPAKWQQHLQIICYAWEMLL